jgi:hypothetical protein
MEDLMMILNLKDQQINILNSQNQIFNTQKMMKKLKI